MNDPLTGKIISAAFTVFNKLGFGFLETVYENALAIDLRKNDIEVEQQVPITVFYDEHEVGQYFADLLVKKKVIVELKSITSLKPEHETQVVNYLTATGKDIGLLLNFSDDGVEIKRKYRVYKRKD